MPLAPVIGYEVCSVHAVVVGFLSVYTFPELVTATQSPPL